MDGRAGGARAEMEDVSQLILIELLHHTPEPSNYLVVGIVRSLIGCVGLPILEIDEGDSIEDHLQLVWLKNLHQIAWDDPFETFPDSLD